MTAFNITRRHGKALSKQGVPPDDAPSWVYEIDNPYLHGLFAPITVETESDNLEVEGEIPKDLFGGYFRNGTNPRFEPTNRYHWFDGDGMIFSLLIKDGKAQYRNRWIRTRAFEMEAEAQKAIWPGVLGPFDFSLPVSPIKDTANTDLVFIDNKLCALWYESGQVYGLDPFTLETDAMEALNKKLNMRVSAHSKIDPNTGDLILFSYGDKPPYMRYGVLKADGELHVSDIELPGPRRPHDIGVTEHYSILHDFPIFHDEEKFQRTGKRVPFFHPDVPTRYGVIPRFGTNADVKWFECEPCYMLHVINCWEEGDWVVQVGCRTTDPSLKPDPQDGELAAMISGITLQANLYQWRMNMTTGEVQEGPIDQLNAEFPTFNRFMMGKKNRYAYLQYIPYEAPATFDALVKYDIQTGAYEKYEYGEGVFASEAPFAPKVGWQDEDDGYVVTFVTDTNTWKSACLIFDAKNIAAGPVAKVHLPHRLSAGFHTLWVPGDDLWGK